jgi:hypothetical protein
LRSQARNADPGDRSYLVDELSFDPPGFAGRSLVDKATPGSRADHGLVLGQSVHLQPMQPMHRETVLAQRPDHNDGQATTAYGRSERESDLGETMMQVDTPQRRVADQLVGGELHDATARHRVGWWLDCERWCDLG